MRGNLKFAIANPLESSAIALAETAHLIQKYVGISNIVERGDRAIYGRVRLYVFWWNRHPNVC